LHDVNKVRRNESVVAKQVLYDLAHRSCLFEYLSEKETLQELKVKQHVQRLDMKSDGSASRK